MFGYLLSSCTLFSNVAIYFAPFILIWKVHEMAEGASGGSMIDCISSSYVNNW